MAIFLRIFGDSPRSRTFFFQQSSHNSGSRAEEEEIAEPTLNREMDHLNFYIENSSSSAPIERVHTPAS